MIENNDAKLKKLSVSREQPVKAPSEIDLNMDCRDAIESAISANYSDNRLDAKTAVQSVIEEFSPERIACVLANTIRQKDYDGRIQPQQKQWAKTIEIAPENGQHFIIDQVNPGLLDLFASEFQKQTVPEVVQVPVEPPKHRLTADEKKIKEAVMDTLKGQITYANDGMRSTYKTSMQSHKTMIQFNVRIEGNTVTRDGEPMFAIHRRHAARKTQGCYRELTPTLEYIGREKSQEAKQEKPSIREQLRTTAAKSQPEKKAPTKQKSHDIGLE